MGRTSGPPPFICTAHASGRRAFVGLLKFIGKGWRSANAAKSAELEIAYLLQVKGRQVSFGHQKLASFALKKRRSLVWDERPKVAEAV